MNRLGTGLHHAGRILSLLLIILLTGTTVAAAVERPQGVPATQDKQAPNGALE